MEACTGMMTICNCSPRWLTEAVFGRIKRTSRHHNHVNRGVIGDIIHYFTLMSWKLTLFALFFIFRHYPLFFQKNENNAINTSKFTIFTSFNGTNIRDLITRQTFVVITCFWRDMGYVAFTRFCRESGFVANTRFFGCLVQTFTQTLRILLRFCADICPKNWPLGPLI